MSSSAVSLNFCFWRLVIMLNAMDSISSGLTRGDVGLRDQDAVDAQIGVVADFQVQVGGLLFDGAAQQIVNIQGHRSFPEKGALQKTLASGTGAHKRAPRLRCVLVTVSREATL